MEQFLDLGLAASRERFEQGLDAEPLLREREADSRGGELFRTGRHRLGGVRVRDERQILLVELPQELYLEVSHHPLDLAQPDRVVAEFEIFADDLFRLVVEREPPVHVEVALPHDGLVDGEHQQATAERAPHGGEA